MALGGALIALALCATPAAANTLSPETPHSPNADDINTLFWIGSVAIVILVAAVNVALLIAVRRYSSERGAEPRQITSGPRLQFRAGLGLGAFAVALFVVAVIYTESAREPAAPGPNGLQASSTLTAQKSLAPPSGDSEPLEIHATGQQWLWRYTYPNNAFSYYKLVVPVDTTVVLDLVSTDVVHSWYVPALGGKFAAVPGKLNHAWFRADEEGTYEGSSAQFSGSAYAAMRTEVEVVSAEEYEAFTEQLAGDLQEAQDALVKAPAAGSAPEEAPQ
jgi:cytochrome c oxidase subunit II